MNPSVDDALPLHCKVVFLAQPALQSWAAHSSGDAGSNPCRHRQYCELATSQRPNGPQAEYTSHSDVGVAQCSSHCPDSSDQSNMVSWPWGLITSRETVDGSLTRNE